MSLTKRLFLIDGSSYFYRAFFALPYLATSDGLPTNAIYGFTNMMHKLINEFTPDHLAIVLDTSEPTFRHEVYQDYKANRPPMPDNLSAQLPYIKDILVALNICIVEKAGFEADDIIGTLAKQAERDGAEVLIISGDKDMFQLVTKHITLLDTMKDSIFDVKAVKEKIGIPPEKAVEFFALTGDAIDNVPGVPGIGAKTATELIREFGSLDGVYENLDKLSKKKVREALQKFKAQAYLSRQLVTINTNVSFALSWNEFRVNPPDTESLRKLYKQFGFSRLLKTLPGEKGTTKNYHLITTVEQLKNLLSQLRQQSAFALDLETTSENPMRAEIVGISFAYQDHESFYIPVNHKNIDKQVPLDLLLKELKPLLEDERIKKVGQNIKYEYIIFRRHGILLNGIHCDTMIASYLLNPSKHNHKLEDIALDYLDYHMTSFKELAGTGKNALTFDLIQIDAAKDYACEDSDITFRLSKILHPRIEKDGFQDLYTQVELPLVKVLAHMEMAGVKLDLDHLNKLSNEFSATLHTIKEKIYQLADQKFNINSHQQLGEILFEKLKLPSQKKTKTGHSTDISVLTVLAKVHPLPAEILLYRSLAKLKSTYIDNMPNLIHPKTARIHTSYNQTVTATGRLSSSEPNLQNIPIRTEEGRRIREAFITDPGWKILSADYSQIELRILAHLSEDQTLIDAFLQDQDIHTRTAAEIWGISQKEVTSQMRREAKVINFGIIYGMSAYGLSQELEIESRLAQAYIDDYFHKYRGIRDYLDQVIENAQGKGYVTTLLNRRRYLPEIGAKNVGIRKFAERTAINAPIQGTAADLIKVAMIRIFEEIEKRKLKAKMIIQVHDELIFEAPEGEIPSLSKLVKEHMEGVVDMKVPLKVDCNWGSNWREAH
jgi:DNA polymerase-1